MIRTAKASNGALYDKRIDPLFHCGFDPNDKTFREYISHLTLCGDWECERRYTNHLLLKVEMQRRYGVNEDRPARSTISVNDEPEALGASNALAVRPASFSKARSSPNHPRTLGRS